MSFFTIDTTKGTATFRELTTEEYQKSVKDFSRHLVLIREIDETKKKLKEEVPTGFSEKLDRILQEQEQVGQRAFDCFVSIMEIAQTGEKKIALADAVEPIALMENIASFIEKHKLPAETEKKIETSGSYVTNGGP